MDSEFMKYAIDRFENNLAILENLVTKEIIEVDITKLPSNIHEGSILIENNGNYIKNLSTEELALKASKQQEISLLQNLIRNYQDRIDLLQQELGQYKSE